MPLQRCWERSSTNEPHLIDNETVQLVQKECGVSVLSGDVVPGALYLTTKRLIWLGEEKEKGFAVDYPYIGLHALSRDLAAFPRACIYCHLQSAAGLRDFTGTPAPPETENQESSDTEGYSVDVGCEPPGELRFVPSDESSLENIFKVMTEMSALNPDDDDSDSDDASDNIAAMMMSEAPPGSQNLWDPAEEEYQEAQFNDE